LYDFFAIFSLIFFIKNANFSLSVVTFSAFLFFTSLAVSSGAHFISFLSVWDNLKHLFVFFILTVAAAEVAIGLAILTLLFRNKGTINVDVTNSLKG
jgi:NADH-quinone oxidoreductase subunit K